MVSLLVSLLLFSMYLSLDFHAYFRFIFQKRGGIFCLSENKQNSYYIQVDSEYPNLIPSQAKYYQYNKSSMELQLYTSLFILSYTLSILNSYSFLNSLAYNTQMCIFIFSFLQQSLCCCCFKFLISISTLSDFIYKF